MGNDTTDLFRSAVAIEATAASDTGTYPIAGTSGQTGNYQVTFQGEGAYTIQPRPITLTIQDHESTYGAELSDGIAQPVPGTDYTAALSPSYDGTGDEALVNGDVLSVTLTTLAAQGSDAGTYAIHIPGGHPELRRHLAGADSLDGQRPGQHRSQYGLRHLLRKQGGVYRGI